MIGGKSNSQMKPYAIGLQPASSIYGQTIPVIIGCVRCPLYLIWANGLRQESSGGKKLKSVMSAGKKGGSQKNYVENVDFLVGTNPIAGVLQFWGNDKARYPLVFTSYSCAVPDFPAGLTVTIPDAQFYFLIGVTLSVAYSETFNDYGGQGAVTQSGTYEIPLWNSAFNGPDPVNNHAYRASPYSYYWAPGSGATVDVRQGRLGLWPAGTLKFYYAQLTPTILTGNKTKAGSTLVPSAILRLTFEPQLGDGSEFSGYPLEQIIYPHYAGLGSPNLDLGSSGMMPNILAEVLGSWPLYASGDADFVDMIEAVMKMGVIQAGFGATIVTSPLQYGLNCSDFPGTTQKGYTASSHGNGVYFDLPQTIDDFLVVFALSTDANTLGIGDGAGNTWVPVMPVAATGIQVWYAQALAGLAGNYAGVTPTQSELFGARQTFAWAEISGFDTVDTTVEASGADGILTISVTTTQAPGTLAYILVYSEVDDVLNPQPSAPFPWKELIRGTAGYGASMWVDYQVVYQPGTYTLTYNLGTPESWKMAAIAFKNSAVAQYPKALGDILEPVTLELTRRQCRANGLWGSVSMDTQKAASDWIEEFCIAANTAPVWSGFKLKLIPWSEVSLAGNGAVYDAPTASGPVAVLTVEDFIGDGKNPPVTVTRKAQVDAPNILQIEHANRTSDYNLVMTSQPDTGSVALYGPRKESPKHFSCIQEVLVARKLLSVAVRRQAEIRNGYSFKLSARWGLLEPMDLISFPLAATMGMVDADQLNVPMVDVRLTRVSEDEEFNLECEAEPFIYGVHAPNAITVADPTPYTPEFGADPGDVNTPIFIEPVSRLTGSSQLQLWIAVSGANAEYGGCQAYISTDGGLSYNAIPNGVIEKAVTGLTVGSWPTAADPDTTNDLVVDLTESLGSLDSYQVVDEDNFVYPCYVEGGNAVIPYELMAYSVATLGVPYHYTLMATGGGTNKLRRAVYGAPAVGAGVTHANGSRFAFLPPSGSGVLKLMMDPTWIGKTLYFKFTAFNTLGGGLQTLADAAPYTYTPTGLPGGSASLSQLTYTLTPASPLTQTNATTLALAQNSAKFQSNMVNYNARTFTIADPGVGNTQIYYVTIADPNYVGDTGALTDRTAYCETTNAKVGVPGYSFMGSIYAAHTGFAGVLVTPGGWPPAQVVTIGA